MLFYLPDKTPKRRSNAHHRPTWDLAGHNHHVGGPLFTLPQHTSSLFHSLLEKVSTERGETLRNSNYAPMHRVEAHPTQSSHITCSFINPVALSTPFHDKPTYNYPYLLFCRIYSCTGPISQMFRVSGHMWANIFILNQSQNLSTRKVNSTVACISY